MTDPVLGALTLEIKEMHLPRAQELKQLPVTLVVDDVLPDDYVERKNENDAWGRLWITLPTNLDPDLPLHWDRDLTEVEGQNPHYYYEKVSREREEELNVNGNVTVTYAFIIKSRDNKELMPTKSESIWIKVSYHNWEEDSYGDAVATTEHSFTRVDGVPNEAPANVTLTPRHHRIHVSWDAKDKISYNNEQESFSPTGVLAIVAEQSQEPISLAAAAMLFRPAAAGGDVPLSRDTSCDLLPDCALDCAGGEIYFDFTKIKSIPALRHSRFFAGHEGVVHDLTPGSSYHIMLQYFPDGVARSVCLTTIPTENLTLMELNDEKKAEREDLRCFIATAVWGRSEVIDHLRWFRDRFLQTNTWGQAFVAAYYRHSPAMADAISSNEPLQVFTRILLLIPLTFVLALKYPLMALLFICTLCLVARRKVKLRYPSYRHS